MSTNKNATIRYQTLDRCFRNLGRRYYIKDLIEACNDALLELDPKSSGIKRRQIYEDIKFMKDSLGFSAPIISIKEGRRAYYRYEDSNYSINNQPLNQVEAQQLKESLLTLSRFKGLPQFDWVEELKVRLEQAFSLKSEENVLSFEENEFLKGREYIGDLYNAIINKQALLIKYKPFKRNEVLKFKIHPYHLKQYNNRWFLFGQDEHHMNITNIALDRIISITNLDIPFKPNNVYNFDELFEDIIGVTFTTDAKPIVITLKATLNLASYIKTKPLHGSQKKIQEDDVGYIFSIEVIPNYELEKLILSFGEELEVIKPLYFKQKIKDRITENLNNYD